MSADDTPTTPMESNLDSRNVEGAFMEETGRATSSRPHYGTAVSITHCRKRETNMAELCDATDNVVEATREKDAIAQEKNVAQRQYFFENAVVILSGMDVDRATYVEAVIFLYEPKWFTVFVMMNDEHRKYWRQTLQDL